MAEKTPHDEPPDFVGVVDEFHEFLDSAVIYTSGHCNSGQPTKADKSLPGEDGNQDSSGR